MGPLDNPICINPTTFMTDGTSVMDSKAFLQHISRSSAELLTYAFRHAHPALNLRLNSDLFNKAITAVVDGRRQSADPWEYSPGWSDADVRLGTDYEALAPQVFGGTKLKDLSIEQLFRLRNSDNVETSHGFNNEKRTQAIQEWKDYTDAAASYLPAVVCAKKRTPKAIAGGYIHEGRLNGWLILFSAIIKTLRIDKTSESSVSSVFQDANSFLR